MCMKNAEYSDCKKILDYQNFIKKCKTKKYSKELVLHKHHIIPKCLWKDEYGDVDSRDNVVMLSVEDHTKAHFLYGISYNSDTIEHISNMRSSRILNGKSVKDKDSMKTIRESYLGEKNPFYGKKHTRKTKEILSKKTVDFLKGKDYEHRYGNERVSEEKEKRRIGVAESWKRMTTEERNIRSLNLSKSLKGKCVGEKNGFATQITVDGVYYGSITEALEKLNISNYLLFKRHKVKKLKKVS